MLSILYSHANNAINNGDTFHDKQEPSPLMLISYRPSLLMLHASSSDAFTLDFFGCYTDFVTSLDDNEDE